MRSSECVLNSIGRVTLSEEERSCSLSTHPMKSSCEHIEGSHLRAGKRALTRM